MSDIVTAKADELRTLALAAEQDIETARMAWDAAIERRDLFLAAANVLELRQFPSVVDVPPAVTAVADTWNAAMGRYLDTLPDTSTPVEAPAPQVKAKKPRVKSAATTSPRSVAAAERDARIAAVACKAHAEGRPMGAAVAEALGISPGAADMAIATARKRGHHIPAGNRATRAPKSDPSKLAPAKPVADRVVRTADDLPGPDERPKVVATISPDVRALRCDDCDFTTEAHRALAMRDHVTVEHGRRILDVERTPRTWAEAMA